MTPLTLHLMLNLKRGVCNFSYLEYKCGGTTTPLFIIFATQNIASIKLRWRKKNLIVVSSHATYFRCIMPRVDIKIHKKPTS
jgi:hypothetical protein